MNIIPSGSCNHGAFFKIKDQDNKTRGYLLGCIHEVIDKSLLELNPKILKALDKATCVGFEELPTISAWEILLIPQEDGIDLKIYKLAVEKKKKLVEVDCPAKVNELSNNITDYLKRNHLPLIINSTPTESLEQAWKEGDMSQIQKASVLDGLLHDQEGYELAKAFNLGRNRGVSEKTVRLIKTGEIPFICDGTAHLPDIERDPRFDDEKQPMEGIVTLIGRHYTVKQVFNHPKAVKEEKSVDLTSNMTNKENPEQTPHLEESREIEAVPEIIEQSDPYKDIKGPFLQIFNAEGKVIATILSQSLEMQSHNSDLVRNVFNSQITPLMSTVSGINAIDNRIDNEFKKITSGSIDLENIILQANLKAATLEEKINQAWRERDIIKLREETASLLALPVSSLESVISHSVINELLSLLQTAQEDINLQLTNEITQSFFRSHSLQEKFFEEPVHHIIGFSGTVCGQQFAARGISDFLQERGLIVK